MRKTRDILPEDRDTFSPKEVAAYLREAEPSLNDSTILRWCQNGKVDAVKPMGRWYVTRNALAKLLVAFGLASHLLATGMQCSAKSIPNTRVIFHKNDTSLTV